MTNQEVAVIGLIISSLTLIISWSIYRLTKKSSLPFVDVEWKTPVQVYIKDNNNKFKVMWCLFEGLFTNSGGKTVSLIELNGHEGSFAIVERLAFKEKITSIPYTPVPHVYILSKPIDFYLSTSDIDEIYKETEIHSFHEVPLNIPIASGITYRFTLCFVFQNYQRQTIRGLNNIIRFSCKFNNGQKTTVSQLLDGTLTIGEKDKIGKLGDVVQNL